MLVNILLQDGRTNYIEGVLRKSALNDTLDRSLSSTKLPSVVSSVIALYLIIALAYFVS